MAKAFSNLTDEEFKHNVALAKKHCFTEAMCSNWYLSQKIYSRVSKAMNSMCIRALRSINPSPYLFFFDYGDFKIFGSSPEAQIIVKNRKGRNSSHRRNLQTNWR
jgi:anthranilate synthase component I